MIISVTDIITELKEVSNFLHPTAVLLNEEKSYVIKETNTSSLLVLITQQLVTNIHNVSL